jgi:hypothetical protein
LPFYNLFQVNTILGDAATFGSGPATLVFLYKYPLRQTRVVT